MQGELTAEYVRSIDLPLNPFRRHRIVGEMLSDPRLVGDVTVLTNSGSFSTEGHRTTITVTTISPLLGRGALMRVARGLEFINNNYPNDNYEVIGE